MVAFIKKVMHEHFDLTLGTSISKLFQHNGPLRVKK